jgi:hypothetical protein
MHFRRIAAFLLGAWLAGSVIVLSVCLSNGASVDEAVESTTAEARQVLGPVGNGNARMILGSLVAVQNPRLLSGWELAELPLGILAALMLFLERPVRLLILLPVVMLLLAGFEHVLITPEIAWLSRLLAFVPHGASISQRRLDTMYLMYGFVEGAKLLVGAVLAVLLFVMRSGRRSRRSHHVTADELLERRAG